MTDWLIMVVERRGELWVRTCEHLLLTGGSTLAAMVLGIPLGVAAARSAWLRGPLLGAIGVLQTIPSLAMLAILLVLLGKIGTLPAMIALTLYALLPIARNTFVGIDGVSADVREAARGMGMTRRQELTRVLLPLSLPTIFAGVRTAAVIGVGIATLSAFIGAGGLGQFINRGLALSNTGLILLGAVPAAILALIVDGALAAAQWAVRPLPSTMRRGWRMQVRPVALAAPVVLIAFGLGALPGGAGRIRIGSKNFTEQFVLGELMAQVIEAETDLGVDRRFNLGGTLICHEALRGGEIDLYAEYSGTGLTAILEHEVVTDRDEALAIVRAEYADRFGLTWLAPFGFNNTYALTVRAKRARQRGWETISDLEASAPTLRAGFTSEFAERPDGLPGLRKAYGLRFGDVRDLDPSLMYKAVANDQVDVICAFATDGRIAAYDLVSLEDDEHFFPPYHAAPVIREETLRAYPEVRAALALLAGKLDDETMRRLNYEVDEKQRTPREVAAEFLAGAEIVD
jgi:osmoprotectant transport system permease protein